MDGWGCGEVMVTFIDVLAALVRKCYCAVGEEGRGGEGEKM